MTLGFLFQVALHPLNYVREIRVRGFGPNAAHLRGKFWQRCQFAVRLAGDERQGVDTVAEPLREELTNCHEARLLRADEPPTENKRIAFASYCRLRKSSTICDPFNGTLQNELGALTRGSIVRGVAALKQHAPIDTCCFALGLHGCGRQGRFAMLAELVEQLRLGERLEQVIAHACLQRVQDGGAVVIAADGDNGAGEMLAAKFVHQRDSAFFTEMDVAENQIRLRG